MAQNQEENKLAFEEFINKPVKLIIKDLDGPHFVRGIVRRVTSEFLFIDGDISQQIVPLSSVIKLSALKKRGENDG